MELLSDLGYNWDFTATWKKLKQPLAVCGLSNGGWKEVGLAVC